MDNSVSFRATLDTLANFNYSQPTLANFDRAWCSDWSRKMISRNQWNINDTSKRTELFKHNNWYFWFLISWIEQVSISIIQNYVRTCIKIAKYYEPYPFQPPSVSSKIDEKLYKTPRCSPTKKKSENGWWKIFLMKWRLALTIEVIAREWVWVLFPDSFFFSSPQS